CSGFAAVDPFSDPLNQPCNCSMPDGVGGGYHAYLFDASGQLISTTAVNDSSAVNDTVSYRPPEIFPNSLRQNRTGYSSVPVDRLALNTASTVRVQFAGAFFAPLQMAVTYALPSGGPVYDCTVVPDQSTDSFVTCDTADNSEGVKLVFTVAVGNQRVT